MILECKVILNNESVTVIRYGNKNVQIPSIGRKTATVKVLDDGRYTVVPDDYTEPEAFGKQPAPELPEKKHRARKKKTIEIEEVSFLEG